MTRILIAVTLSAAMGLPVLAADPDLALDPGADTQVTAQGTLNPHEMSMARVMDNIRQGDTGMVTCSMGYLVTKSGRHDLARELFRQCADAGYTGAMTWMSQLQDNGLGGPQDLAAASEWNRRAAEAGDPVGKFNRGLDLMRGWGVDPDPDAGRRLIDEAADQGLAVARRLRGADYDLDEVTPDADAWRYQRLF